MDAKHRGAVSELAATVWLLEQGYEVFRNVSCFGPIDLVAVRDGETLLIDVKTGVYRKDGKPAFKVFRDKQIAQGVKALIVMPDGKMIMEHDPEVLRFPRNKKCIECGSIFQSGSRRILICSDRCRMDRLNRQAKSSKTKNPEKYREIDHRRHKRAWANRKKAD